MRKIILLSIFALIFSVSYSQSKITGGFNLNIEQSPWQVLLMSDGSYVCGGIIITPSYILTAKHCVDLGARRIIKKKTGVTCKHEITSSNIHSVNQIILHSTLDVALL